MSIIKNVWWITWHLMHNVNYILHWMWIKIHVQHVDKIIVLWQMKKKHNSRHGTGNWINIDTTIYTNTTIHMIIYYITGRNVDESTNGTGYVVSKWFDLLFAITTTNRQQVQYSTYSIDSLPINTHTVVLINIHINIAYRIVHSYLDFCCCIECIDPS